FRFSRPNIWPAESSPPRFRNASRFSDSTKSLLAETQQRQKQRRSKNFSLSSAAVSPPKPVRAINSRFLAIFLTPLSPTPQPPSSMPASPCSTPANSCTWTEAYVRTDLPDLDLPVALAPLPPVADASADCLYLNGSSC